MTPPPPPRSPLLAFLARHRLPILIIVIGKILLVGGLFLLAWKTGWTPASLGSHWGAFQTVLTSNPALFFLAIAILPGLAFPISPLLVLAGSVYGPAYGLPLTCALCIGALTVNLTWTWWLAAYPCRSLIERLANRVGYVLPAATTPKARLRLLLLVRLTPGFPLFAQNYLLGLAHIPFWQYFFISIALQTPTVIGFVVFSGAIFSGKIGYALLGVSIVIIAIILIKILREKYTPDPAKIET